MAPQVHQGIITLNIHRIALTYLMLCGMSQCVEGYPASRLYLVVTVNMHVLNILVPHPTRVIAPGTTLEHGAGLDVQRRQKENNLYDNMHRTYYDKNTVDPTVIHYLYEIIGTPCENALEA